MAPDEFQQAWQAQSSQTRMTVDADQLLKAVHKSHASFRAMIFGRDLVEVSVALVMIPVWLIMGVTMKLPWTWYLGIPSFLFVAGFFVVDRKRHPQRAEAPGEPLATSAQESLRQVEHQIWLLRNVFWWYLLPGIIPAFTFFADVFRSTWTQSPPQPGFETFIAVCCVIFLYGVVSAVYGFVYYVNQKAVRVQLEPRRAELLKLLASLNEESTGDAAADYPILTGAVSPGCEVSPRRRLISVLTAVAIVAVVIPGLLYLGHRIEDAYDPKKSPFEAVRWEETEPIANDAGQILRHRPEVQINGEWFELVSLNDLPASDIIFFSQMAYGDLWQKRFEEDLVELLTAMGHGPKDSVRLVVKPMGSQETRVLENVRMTRANRQAIWDAGQARKKAAGGTK